MIRETEEPWETWERIPKTHLPAVFHFTVLGKRDCKALLLPLFCSNKFPKFPKVTMSGKSTPGKTGRTAAARYSLQRQKDNEGVDDIRPTQDIVMCIPIGSKFSKTNR